MENRNNGKDSVILPGQTIGVLGGGQLGRMMALAGRAMGYRFVTLDPTPDSPCGQVCDDQVLAEFTDVDGARQLAAMSDVITYEFENVDAAVAHVLEQEAYVPQGSQLLYTTQHRHREKEALASHGFPVAPYELIFDIADLGRAVQRLGVPCVVKTSQGGYDGKGQFMVRTASDVDACTSWVEKVLAALVPERANGDAGAGADVALTQGTQPGQYAPLVVEKFVPYMKEVSVVVARNPRGEVRSFPVAENIHVNHILHLSIVPARVSEEVQRKARELAEAVADRLQITGVLGVEMFLVEDGSLFINELAPRPHNSGHFTMDACVTSQFEQHVRAVCNLPLGDVTLLHPVVMVNILGQHLDPVLNVLPELPPHMKFHLYGKHEAKTGRKMGHINVLCDDVEEGLQEIEAMGIWRQNTNV